MKLWTILFLASIYLNISNHLFGQQTESKNLVPNGSFESFQKCPNELGDFFVSNWYSIASYSSPDLFSTCADNGCSANPNWYYCRVKPYADSSFIGILLADKKTTYREYISTRLVVKLKKDRIYKFSIALAIPHFSAYTVEKLDIVFSLKSILGSDGHTIIEKKTTLSIKLDSMKTDGTWTLYNFEYKATGNEQYISIGNFESKKNTKMTKIPDRTDKVFKTIYNSAYICIDNVSIFSKDTPSSSNTNFSIKKDSLKKSFSPKIGEPVVLSNIFFLSNKSELLQQSFEELDKLVQYLKVNLQTTIQISGHSDNIGNNERNKILSEERAKAVADYLILNGIDKSRITYNGYGSSKPITTNDTESGRQQNRRVEFIINIK
jgi:OmpA-OmpF porin, OOP family